jgi:hypothetical protein
MLRLMRLVIARRIDLTGVSNFALPLTQNESGSRHPGSVCWRLCSAMIEER